MKAIKAHHEHKKSLRNVMWMNKLNGEDGGESVEDSHFDKI